MCWLTVFWSPRKTCMISYSFRNLPGILFNLHLLLQALVARRSLVLLFTLNGPRWQDSEHLLRVMCFIHSRLSRLRFALRRDIIDHRDIQLLSFFNRGKCQFLMNVYLDDLHTAVDFLTREALNIPNLLYIGGDFNIRDTEWNPSILSYPAADQSLRDPADSYSLVHSLAALSVLTYYLDISDHTNSVIDLIFLGISCAQVVHHIEPDLRRPSDHAPLIFDLPIASENI